MDRPKQIRPAIDALLRWNPGNPIPQGIGAKILEMPVMELPGNATPQANEKLPEVERLKVLSEITEPKVIKVHGEGGVPMPLQSVVEGAKLATFIDRSVARTIILLREHGDDLFKAMATVLEAIDGKLVVQNMGYELLSFLGDAYLAVRYY